MNPIEPQKDDEGLESRLEAKAEELLDSVPENEPEEETESVAPVMSEEELEEHVNEIDEPEEIEPILASVGVIDFSSETHVSPQVLEDAHKFLNRYGIKTDQLTPKEVMHKIEKIQAAREVAAQVLSRGQALDGIERLLSFVPEGYVGEFKRENDMEVARARALGFEVFEDKRANLESSTGKSDGLVRLGDQILMIIREETYVAHRLAKADRLAEKRKAHDPKSATIDQGSADALVPLIKL